MPHVLGLNLPCVGGAKGEGTHACSGGEYLHSGWDRLRVQAVEGVVCRSVPRAVLAGVILQEGEE